MTNRDEQAKMPWRLTSNDSDFVECSVCETIPEATEISVPVRDWFALILEAVRPVKILLAIALLVRDFPLLR